MNMENPFKDSEERLLFAKVLDKYTAARKNSSPAYTDFMDPVRSATFLQTLKSSDYFQIISYGGFDDAERKIIAFFPDSHEAVSFPIVPVAITYNQRFSKAPTHRDYLGAVLGLGLDRGKIGDIRLGHAGAVMYVAEEVAHFIAENLDQVGRVSVKASANCQLEGLETTNQTRRITVPSMRLDAVLSAALNLSRGKASLLIEAEKVFVNWKLAKKTHTVAVGDAITVRGMGRVSIDSLGGSTKKDRTVLQITICK